MIRTQQKEIQMNNMELDDIEAASPSVVHAAARDFAAVLSETPQFKAFEKAYEALNKDTAAHGILSAYQAKAKSLRAILMLNAASDAERAELEQLKNEYVTRPTVQAYAAAETELTSLCQQTAGMISSAIGLNYAASCGASCCG
jgi:cell fate (sporulation/competence/biofilm development) regulator YlbF (YheA/YmcA/DUF963 family)